MKFINMNKKAQALVAAVIIILIGSIMGVTIVSLFGANTGTTINYMRGQQAFFIADGGLEYYFKQLKDQSSSWVTPPAPPTNMALGIGTFTITTSNAQANEIDVTSTANVIGLDGVTTVRVVTAHFTRGASTPTAYDNVLYSNTITLQGNPSITGIQYPNATDFPTVTFSGASSYQSAATYNFSGNRTLTGTYNGNVYVDGNVVIGANSVVINGFLVATGSISSVSRTGFRINPTAPYPAMIANNNISFTDMRGTNTMNGLIYAGADGSGSVTLSMRNTGKRRLDFSGTIMAHDTITLNRNGAQFNIVYNSAIKTNPPPYISGGGGTGTGGVTLWDEVY